jgi:hypothetical protein
MADERSNRTVNVFLPAAEVVAEARQWDVSDEVALRVLDAGATSVMASSPRGRRFLEHLVSLQRQGDPRSRQHTADIARRSPAFHSISSPVWLEIVMLAGRIQSSVASGRRVDAASAIKLARTISALNGPDESTSGIFTRPARSGSS